MMFASLVQLLAILSWIVQTVGSASSCMGSFMGLSAFLAATTVEWKTARRLYRWTLKRSSAAMLRYEKLGTVEALK
jgi:hypothetical protein